MSNHIKLYQTLVLGLVSLLLACTSSPPATPARPTLAPAPHAVATATVNTPTLHAVETAIANLPSLRLLVDKLQLQVGCRFTEGEFDDPKWRAVVGNVCNLAVVDWGFAWKEIEPQPGQFDFAIVDKQIALARSKNMVVRGQLNLSPDLSSLTKASGKENLSRDELTNILQNHIAQAVRHYKGQISQWVLVHRPYIQLDRRDDDVLYSALGYDYLDLALQTARQADPSAILIYHGEIPSYVHAQEAQLTDQTVERLKSKGLIDGFGFRMRQYGKDPLSKQNIRSAMYRYGIPVHLTEFDVDLFEVSGSSDERGMVQAKTYSDMLDICLGVRVCKSFTLGAEPTTFDGNLNPHPAYSALVEALCSALTGSCAPTPTPILPSVAQAMPLVVEDISGLSIDVRGNHSITTEWQVQIRNNDTVEHVAQIRFEWEEEWHWEGGPSPGWTGTMKRDMTTLFRIPPNTVKRSPVVVFETTQWWVAVYGGGNMRYNILAIDGKPLKTP